MSIFEDGEEVSLTEEDLQYLREAAAAIWAEVAALKELSEQLERDSVAQPSLASSQYPKFKAQFDPQAEARNLQAAKRERDLEVWRLKGVVFKLVNMAVKQGWPTRLSRDWMTLLYFNQFASVPGREFDVDLLPTYPVYRMRRSAERYLENPALYWSLYTSFRDYQFHKQQKKGS